MSLRETIAEMANAEVPKEACGFVLNDGSAVSCTNVDDAPWYRFTIDSDEARQWYGSGRVVAVWHSHPTGPAVPSEGDEIHALNLHTGLTHYIYSVEDEDLGAYRVNALGRLELMEMVSPS